MTRSERLRRKWDGQAATYDQRLAPLERRYLAASRAWVCRRAVGNTLELAVGTGLNFPHYPHGVTLTGVDWSEQMVATAERRARHLRKPIALEQADALDLPFSDGRFDTVVCTFALCCVPDERAALAEAIRVLRPGGRLLLADHVIAGNVLLRGLQHIVELVSVPWQGEHYTRRPLLTARRLGVEVVDSERLTHGMIERVDARTPV